MMFLNGSDEVPERFLCPITDRPMTEPVIASDGSTYERQSIQGVFDSQTTQCHSPCTGKKMTDFTLTPNDNLLADMKKWFVEIAQKDEFATMADIDGDGQVTEEEAELWSKRRGDQQNDDYYCGRDRDGDGVVDMDEFFTGMWERIVEGDWVDDPDSVFRLLDKGKVGSVCLDDIKDVLTELADVDHDGVISAEELQQREENIVMWERLFSDFDEDGNNEISMQEFRAAFNRSFIRAGRGIPPPPKQWARNSETPEWVQHAVSSGLGVANCDRAFN